MTPEEMKNLLALQAKRIEELERQNGKKKNGWRIADKGKGVNIYVDRPVCYVTWIELEFLYEHYHEIKKSKS